MKKDRVVSDERSAPGRLTNLTRGGCETLEVLFKEHQESFEEEAENQLYRHLKVQLPPFDSHWSHGTYLHQKIASGP
jgi:hypothetical protein